MSYQGDVSVRQALQLSLNVPAVRLLDAVGPARLTARFRQAGVTPELPRDEPPGLAIGLGGVGITLHDLVQLYTGLSNGGQVKPLHDGTEPGGAAPPAGGMILDAQAAWQIADILSGVRPPEGAPARGIAYKTGTSYGYRDAWSIGFDGRYVLGVWIGRRGCLGDGRACRAMSRRRPCCSKGLPDPASRPCRCAPRLPAPFARSARSCRSPWSASHRPTS